MIIPDKKRLATMIVAQVHPSADEGKDAMEGGDTYESLAEQIMEAVKSGSAGDLAEALKAFHYECEMDEEDSEG